MEVRERKMLCPRKRSRVRSAGRAAWIQNQVLALPNCVPVSSSVEWKG